VGACLEQFLNRTLKISNTMIGAEFACLWRSFKEGFITWIYGLLAVGRGIN
jgi:hypothetical protein